MSTEADPLAVLGGLPGVADSVDSVRKAVDRVYGHRVMRRRSNEITSEAALRGARGSAALAGADWALEEVRRRSDFGGEGEPWTVGAALRLTAEAGQLLGVWRQSPLRALARLHLVAAGGAVPDETVGRPRLTGESVTELPLPDADDMQVAPVEPAPASGDVSSEGAASGDAASEGAASAEAVLPEPDAPLPERAGAAAVVRGQPRHGAAGECRGCAGALAGRGRAGGAGTWSRRPAGRARRVRRRPG
ncbi:oxidoreductase [Streptomyces pathocidini]|uniref:oxidoreductase n=1 Tax=Streptomyces pathocidini TaxID=1650571 RepID=UPI003B8A721C